MQSFNSWQAELAASLTRPEQLAGRFGIDPAPLRAVAARFPLRVTPHYLGLIREPGDPIWRQCVPDPAELAPSPLAEDPLAEAAHSPVPGLIHRYPDRALLLVSSVCAVYCRFCTRKRQVGCSAQGSGGNRLEAALVYLAGRPEVREVILSGGDPLLLADEDLARLLEGLRRLPHIELLRIGSRAPVVLPRRITDGLCELLRRFQPLYLLTHFNHPRELTAEAAEACRRLADAGIPLANQTVLLRGVNDRAETLAELFRGLLRLRVRPYYLHHLDLVAGAAHFRVALETGIDIMHRLRGNLSGLAIPQYVVDTPGGLGKVPVLPGYLERLGPTAVLRTSGGERVEIPNQVPD